MTQKTSYFNEIFRMDVFCDEEKGFNFGSIDGDDDRLSHFRERDGPQYSCMHATWKTQIIIGKYFYTAYLRTRKLEQTQEP